MNKKMLMTVAVATFVVIIHWDKGVVAAPQLNRVHSTYIIPTSGDGEISVTEWTPKAARNVRCVATTHYRGAGVTCFEVKGEGK